MTSIIHRAILTCFALNLAASANDSPSAETAKGFTWPSKIPADCPFEPSATLTGPWRMVSYMEDFGEQAYFLNFPSKFISDDGRTLWLAYSANFTTNNGKKLNGIDLKINPPGGRYGLSLHELHLLGPKNQTN